RRIPRCFLFRRRPDAEPSSRLRLRRPLLPRSGAREDGDQSTVSRAPPAPALDRACRQARVDQHALRRRTQEAPDPVRSELMASDSLRKADYFDAGLELLASGGIG